MTGTFDDPLVRAAYKRALKQMEEQMLSFTSVWNHLPPITEEKLARRAEEEELAKNLRAEELAAWKARPLNERLIEALSEEVTVTTYEESWVECPWCCATARDVLEHEPDCHGQLLIAELRRRP